jgi:hypothetical protein
MWSFELQSTEHITYRNVLIGQGTFAWPNGIPVAAPEVVMTNQATCPFFRISNFLNIKNGSSTRIRRI